MADARSSERVFERALRAYDRSLSWSLDNPGTIMVVLAMTIGLNVYLFSIISKGFFPQQDTGSIIGGIRADQSISFQLMQPKFNEFVTCDPAKTPPVSKALSGFPAAGGGQTNSGFVFITLKPLSERPKNPADHVIARLRNEGRRACRGRAAVPGAGSGFARGRAPGQCAISVHHPGGPVVEDIETWVPKITEALKNVPELKDVNSDLQEAGSRR